MLGKDFLRGLTERENIFTGFDAASKIIVDVMQVDGVSERPQPGQC
jgi:hypothetical protein